ncbi:MAG: ATP-binding protein [Ginsengibacter sp.]
MYNKLLKRQLQKNFGALDEIPAGIMSLLKVISDSYDHYEKDRKMIEHSIDLSSNEMIELNNNLRSDIKEREKTEERLIASEVRLREIIDLVPHFIFAKDISGKFILANKAVADVYGSTIENLLGKSDADFNSNQEEVEHFLKHDLMVIESGKEEFNKEEIITDARGNVLTLSTTKIPFTASGTDVPAVLGFSIDISDRKKAEQELERSISILEATIESTADGILVADFNGKIVRFNNKFVELWRIPKEILSSRDDEKAIAFVLDQLVNPEEFISKVKELYIKKNDLSFDIFHCKDGRIFERYSQPQLINGECVGRVWNFRNITESKLAEETLLRSEADLEIKNMELEIKNRELEQFAYVASHDLQEPLRTTSSFVELLQTQYSEMLDDRANQYLTFITQSSDRMRMFIKDLLDYSRIGRKKDLEQIDCNSMLSLVLEDLNKLITDENPKIHAEHLPVINGYPTDIQQLFQNLVMNAIKFRKKNTTPEIEISAKLIPGYWEFAFSDNGIGIDEKHNERIFIIFQRLHTRGEYKGSGIGLSHCKKIVELHGGKIWVKSNPGEGATFYFTISANNR